MKKRVLALLICLALVFTMLPVSVSAEEDPKREEQIQQIRDRIRDFYYKTLRACGDWTLEGWCGFMAGWELYLLGITDYPQTYNGNDQYDAYEKLTVTDMGYAVRLYPATEYTMEEALNTMTRSGTMDALNVMAGFHKTRTAAGQRWGHVTVIHAILDGTVYYTEGFDTPYGLKPEEAHICSIAEWADFYESWTVFEGMVDFGTKAYTDFLTYYPADLFVMTRQPVQLYTQPGGEDAQPLRQTLTGERLHAIGIYADAEGQLYYQLREDQLCYAKAEGLEPWRFSYEDVTWQNITLPQQLEAGQDFDLAGDIHTVNNRLQSISLLITDEKGQSPVEYIWEKDSCSFALDHKSVNQAVDFSQLEPGQYTCTLSVQVNNHYVQDGTVVSDGKRIQLASQAFAVGQALQEQPVQQTFAPEMEDGWQYRDGSWYYYRQGQPRTGWFYEEGRDYYFLEDGAAATGWQTVQGKLRFFTPSGLMHTGWLRDESGVRYMLRNGVAATGWRQIDGALYCFGNDTLMLTDTQLEWEGKTYTIDADGKATPMQ